MDLLPDSRPKDHGLSLVELLMVIAIAAAVIAIILVVFSKTWSLVQSWK